METKKSMQQGRWELNTREGVTPIGSEHSNSGWHVAQECLNPISTDLLSLLEENGIGTGG